MSDLAWWMFDISSNIQLRFWHWNMIGCFRQLKIPLPPYWQRHMVKWWFHDIGRRACSPKVRGFTRSVRPARSPCAARILSWRLVMTRGLHKILGNSIPRASLPHASQVPVMGFINLLIGSRMKSVRNCPLWPRWNRMTCQNVCPPWRIRFSSWWDSTRLWIRMCRICQIRMLSSSQRCHANWPSRANSCKVKSMGTVRICRHWWNTKWCRSEAFCRSAPVMSSMEWRYGEGFPRQGGVCILVCLLTLGCFMGALIPTVCAIAFYMFLQMTVCQPRQSAVKVRPWRFFILMSAGLLRIGEASNPASCPLWWKDVSHWYVQSLRSSCKGLDFFSVGWTPENRVASDLSGDAFDKVVTKWWFQTWILFSISYLGCHPSHWRIFFKIVITPPTSYGFYGSLGSVRPVRSGRLVRLAQPSRATQQPSHQSNPGTSRKSQAATKASSSSSSSSPRRSPAAAEATNQHLQRYCLHSFLGPGLPTFAIWGTAPPPGAAGPIVLRLRRRPKHWK